MIAALRTEYRKFTSTRMWWILALVMMAYLGVIAAFMAFAITADPSGGMMDTYSAMNLHGAEAARTVYALANPIGYVFPLVIGSLAFTGEFRHQTITASLLADPRRTVLLVAKLVASVVIGLFYGVIGTAATVGATAPILAWQGDGHFLGDADVLQAVGLSVAVLTVWAVMGVAFGGLVSNQVAAIVIILATTQFVEPILRVIGGTFDALATVTSYLPSAAADAVIGTSFYGAMGASTDLLSRPVGAAVLLGYVVVFSVLARLVTLRRDIA